MKKLVLLLVVLLSLALSVSAQDGSSPLSEMMALVPDNEFSRSDIIYYQDLRAVENARDYLSRPESGPAFLASRPWIGFTTRWIGLPPQIASFAVPLMEEMPATVGIDFFDINRTLSFASPPATTTIWSGDFNLDAIAEAHEARGYQPSEINGIPAICGAEGCDSGMQQNLTNLEHGNLFDPALGRQVPFLIQPETLVSSTSLEILESVADASVGNSPSLLDVPNYRTVVEAITDPSAYSGELVSALMLPVDVVLLEVDLADPGSLRLPQARADALSVGFAGYGELPAYQLAALADRQEDEWQVAIITLVYDSAEDAEIAATELAQRIETFSGFIVSRRDQPFLNRFPSATVESRVYMSDSGSAAAVVEVRYATPTQEEELDAQGGSDDEPPRVPAAFYRYLVESIYQRALYPLWIVSNVPS